MNDRELIRYWASLINESELDFCGSEESNYLEEAGGTEYITRGNTRVETMIDTLVSKTFVVGDPHAPQHLAFKSEKEVSSPDEFKSPKYGDSHYTGDMRYAVVNKSSSGRPYDILIQHLKDDNTIEDVKIEVKTSEQSSMFQKTVTFVIDQKTGDVISPFERQLELYTSNTINKYSDQLKDPNKRERASKTIDSEIKKFRDAENRKTDEFWKLFGKIPESTRKELASNFSRIIFDYLGRAPSPSVKRGEFRLNGSGEKFDVIPEITSIP